MSRSRRACTAVECGDHGPDIAAGQARPAEGLAVQLLDEVGMDNHTASNWRRREYANRFAGHPTGLAKLLSARCLRMRRTTAPAVCSPLLPHSARAWFSALAVPPIFCMIVSRPFPMSIQDPSKTRTPIGVVALPAWTLAAAGTCACSWPLPFRINSPQPHPSSAQPDPRHVLCPN